MKRLLTTAFIVLVLTGLLGACGDDSSKDAGPATLDPGATGADGNSGDGADNQGDSEEAPFEYAECMREHGINMPDPKVGENGELQLDLNGEGSTPEQMKAAEDACGHFLEDARQDAPPVDPDEVARRQDAALELAKCMREKGWDFPDPEVDENGGIGIAVPDGAQPGTPKADQFEEDQRACHEEAGLDIPGEGDGQLSERGKS